MRLKVRRVKSEKIRRDAFLYLEQAKPWTDFAYCSSCIMWTGPEYETCTIHGQRRVTGEMSCGFYMPGAPEPANEGSETDRFTPEESGLVVGPVQCRTCKYFYDESQCGLFEQLNKTMPDHWDLDETVSPLGCCNAHRLKT